MVTTPKKSKELSKPVIGVIIGLVLVLVVVSGILIFKGSAPPSTNQVTAERKNIANGIQNGLTKYQSEHGSNSNPQSSGAVPATGQ